MLYYLGSPMKPNFLRRLSIIYPFHQAYFSEPLDHLASTVSHQNSGISTLFNMGHCFFQTSRSHSNSKLTPFPKYLSRCYILYTEMLPRVNQPVLTQPYVPDLLIKHPTNPVKQKVLPQPLTSAANFCSSFVT